MTLFVAPILEGETEVRCIKIILSRIWRELLHANDLEPLAVLEPIPARRSSLVKDGHPELGQMVERAFRAVGASVLQPGANRGFVLLLIDADEDCPAELGPQLAARASGVRSDADIVCVLAKRELENWFKAAAASLAGVSGLPEDLSVPEKPEHGSGDNWLTGQIQRKDRKRKYTKPADAVELAQRMDLQQCRDNAPSFDKLCRELEARHPQPPKRDRPVNRRSKKGKRHRE